MQKKETLFLYYWCKVQVQPSNFLALIPFHRVADSFAKKRFSTFYDWMVAQKEYKNRLEYQRRRMTIVIVVVAILSYLQDWPPPPVHFLYIMKRFFVEHDDDMNDGDLFFDQLLLSMHVCINIEWVFGGANKAECKNQKPTYLKRFVYKRRSATTVPWTKLPNIAYNVIMKRSVKISVLSSILFRTPSFDTIFLLSTKYIFIHHHCHYYCVPLYKFFFF